MSKPQVTTLKNGLTVITQQVPGEQVYANITVNVGNRHEAHDHKDVAHFLEHMAASETQRMNIPEREAYISNRYGTSNAMTMDQYTGYHIQMNSKFTEDAIELLADGFLRPKFDDENVKNERKSVEAELRNGGTNPGLIASVDLASVAYPDMTVGERWLDIASRLGDHTTEKLQAFKDKHYTADNMALAVVGNVKHEDVVKFAEKHFDGLPEKLADGVDRKPTPAVFRGGMKTFESKEAEEVVLNIAFEGTGEKNPEQSAVDTLLAFILGRGESSRLHQSLVEDKQAVRQVYANNDALEDNGLFVISARTTIDQSKDVVDTIAQESLKLASTVTQKEMDKVKNQLLGIVERSVESIDDIGSELAIKKAVGGKIYDIDDDIALLKNVTLEQLQARAAEIFSTPPAVSAHGNNLEKLPSYEEISGAFGAVRHLDENGLLIQTEQERAAAVQRANAPGTAPATKTPSTSSPDSVDTASKESGELKPEMTVLENGLKVITVKMPTKQIYAELDAAVGDRHETAAEAGIVNVLGKLGRSASERLSVEEKGETIANLRGTSSGGVAAEHSTFNIRASNEFSEEALKILAESVTSPKLDDASIEKQKLAYKKQLIGQKNEARPNAKEQLYRLAFPGSQLDKNILSNPQAVDAISPEQLKAFREKNYTADNLTLTVVGDVDHAEIVKQAKAEFAGLAKGEAKAAVPPAKYRGGMEVKNNNEVDQVTMMIGFEGSDRSDPKTSAIDTLIGSILGGGFSSRLMSNLRTDKGYVYSVSASNTPVKDGGLFSISTWTEEKNLAPVIDEITKEVTRFASTVTQDELDVFKNDMIGNYERALASPESVGSIIGSQMANSGTLADFKEKIQNFKDVTLEDIQRRATEIFSTAPSVAAFGKGADKMPSYEEISEKFGKRRTLDASGLAVDTAPANDRSVKGADVAAQPQDKKRAIG